MQCSARARRFAPSSPLLCLSALVWCACAADDVRTPRAPDTRVGRGAGGRTETPVNQALTPHGATIDLPKLRPQALALSADGARLYVSGKTSELVVLDAATGALSERVALPAEDARAGELVGQPVSDHILEPDKKGQLSYTGLIEAPDGRALYLSNVNGSVKVFRVDEAGRVTPAHSLPLPSANAPRRQAEIPSGLALHAGGQRLLVCGNLSNRLIDLDATTGAVHATYDVGVAPYDVLLAGGRAFVSNWGGPRPDAASVVGPAGQGTLVRVDARGIASEGSVSIVDLATGSVREVSVGLHPSALALSPDGRHVVVANAGSDTLTVLRADTGAFVETIWCKPKPSDLLGATPTALTFDPTGERLYVAHGTQNAIGVYEFEPDDRGDSRLLGLIPVGWFPGALAHDATRGRLAVANIKGIGPGRARDGERVNEHNTHQYYGSVTLAPLPDREELEALSAAVQVNLRRPAIEAALAPPRKGVAPVAIPERIGEPSLIEHVVYIIKENRTYDQVLGDMPEGDGDPTLCIYGEDVTPNQHALAREFALLDNTYCAGILSADGHNWSTSAFGTDYLERSFAGWPRSYPDGMEEEDKDALAYSPAGFLWDNALAAGVTLRNYGEFCQPRVRWADAKRRGAPDFTACYLAWRDKTDAVVFESEAVVPSLAPHSVTRYVGWNMSVPDQYRADVVLEDLARAEALGALPQLTIICLPNDHTSGTAEGAPTPEACMADGDLALGRIIEGLSRSRFWPRMAVFVIEDDPQAGWDHVSGYRTTAFVASPYARRGVTVSKQYNTTSILRTIEQILGLQPMNQFDASASPMFECFTDTPDETAFAARPNLVPLDRMNPPKEALTDPVQHQDAVASAALDLSVMDRAPEDLLNRILWRAARGSAAPYPEWALTPGADADEDD
ncbi:MAG: alkaline phosphatase family protein [Planctomycetota bacterium]